MLYLETWSFSDLGLKKKYTLMRCALASPTYNSLIIEVNTERFRIFTLARISAYHHGSRNFPNDTPRSPLLIYTPEVLEPI